MKYSLTAMFLAINLSLSGTTFYVAISGSDNNPGTFNQPFASWQKGFTKISAGDTLFIRGGTYYPSGTAGSNYFSGVYQNNHDGTSSSLIYAWAYPGEEPVLDCRNITQTASHIGLNFINCDYWHIKGLTITRADQLPKLGAAGIRFNSCNNIKLERMTSHHNGGSGIQVLYDSENNILLNCDSYYNYDMYSTPLPGGHADGIEIADIRERNGNERINTMIGCRSWHNSDDGYDHFRCDGMLVFKNCWAWHNGYVPGTETASGNGEGFKFGATFGVPEPVWQRQVINCIAFDNRTIGFSQNGANVLMEFFNNVAYKNKCQGFIFYAYNNTDILKNNISYKNGVIIFSQTKQIIDHNSWQNGLNVSDADFLSLDGTQLSRPRKADGSLPDIDFLHLSAVSDLIDSGAEAGLPFNGKAPDIGAFETIDVGKNLNQLPVVNISSDTKGVSYIAPLTMTINVEIVDGDGKISKVELFNLTTKIAEITEAPYTFTLKNLPEGYYSLTAVATYDIKSEAISPAFDFRVSPYDFDREYFNLYPNPNNGFFSIDFSTLFGEADFNMTIINSSGKIVYEEYLLKETFARQYNLSNLNPGIYILMIKSDLIVVTQKFIKS